MCATLTLAQTLSYVSKSSLAVLAAAMPPLTGRYEVVVPGRNEIIFFTDSLDEAARHVAIARWGNANKTEEVLAFLTGVEKHGFLRPNEQGVRVHRPLDDGSPWMAQVRGTQPRPQPKYAIGDLLEVSDEKGALPPHLKAGRQVRVAGVSVINDRRAGKHYGYAVGGGASQRVSEDRLRVPTSFLGELDFDSLSA